MLQIITNVNFIFFTSCKKKDAPSIINFGIMYYFCIKMYKESFYILIPLFR